MEIKANIDLSKVEGTKEDCFGNPLKIGDKICYIETRTFNYMDYDYHTLGRSVTETVVLTRTVQYCEKKNMLFCGAVMNKDYLCNMKHFWLKGCKQILDSCK